jgi:hypothetical protein
VDGRHKAGQDEIGGAISLLLRRRIFPESPIQVVLHGPDPRIHVFALEARFMPSLPDGLAAALNMAEG